MASLMVREFLLTLKLISKFLKERSYRKGDRIISVSNISNGNVFVS